MKKLTLLVLVFCLFLSAGCVKMRDYTSTRKGCFAVDIQRGFGQGEDKKDYYMVDDSTALIVRDTVNEVRKKIGLPDEIERMVDGTECWIYKSKRLKLYFNQEYLESWEEI